MIIAAVIHDILLHWSLRQALDKYSNSRLEDQRFQTVYQDCLQVLIAKFVLKVRLPVMSKASNVSSMRFTEEKI